MISISYFLRAGDDENPRRKPAMTFTYPVQKIVHPSEKNELFLGEIEENLIEYAD